MSRRRRGTTAGNGQGGAESGGGSQELRELQVRADEAYERMVETIAAQTAQDMDDEVKGWQMLSGSPGTDDLSNADLAEARRRSVALWQIDPSIGQAAMLLQSGTFGRGITTPTAVDRRVQKVVNRFWEDPDVQMHLTSRSAQIQLNLALMLKGEAFPTIHVSPTDSVVKVAEIDQGEITQVITHPEDRRKPILYERRFRAAKYNFTTRRFEPDAQETTWYYRDWRYIPEMRQDGGRDEEAEAMFAAAPGLQEGVYVYHLKVNTIGLRGIPEVYRAYDWAKAHSRGLSDLATWIKAAAMFAWRVKMQTKSQGAVEKRARMFREPVPGAAAVHVSSDKLDLTAVDQPRGSDQMVTGAKQLHLQEIRPFGFGAHWYSDVDQGTLATANNMDMPSMWRIEDRQETFREPYRDLCQVAIAIALARRDFVIMPQSVDRYVDVDFPPAQPAQVLQVSQAITNLAPRISPREAARQAYQALGCNDIDQLLEEQFPPQTKADGKAAEPEGEGEGNGGDGSQELGAGPAEQVAEAFDEGVIQGPFSSSPGRAR